MRKLKEKLAGVADNRTLTSSTCTRYDWRKVHYISTRKGWRKVCKNVSRRKFGRQLIKMYPPVNKREFLFEENRRRGTPVPPKKKPEPKERPRQRHTVQKEAKADSEAYGTTKKWTN